MLRRRGRTERRDAGAGAPARAPPTRARRARRRRRTRPRPAGRVDRPRSSPSVRLLPHRAGANLVLAHALPSEQDVLPCFERLQLALPLQIAVPPLPCERAVGERSAHGAPRLAVVGAVGEATVRRDLLDVAEGLLQVCAPQLQLAD